VAQHHQQAPAELVPAEAIPAHARNPAGERWQRELVLVGQWLAEKKGNTRATYADAIGWPYDKHGANRDTAALRNGVTWLSWAAARGVHLLDARRADVVAWANALNDTPHPQTGLALTHATRGHTFTTASAFYRWAVKAGVAERNPMDLIDRASLGVDIVKGLAMSRSLTAAEVGALLVAADHDPVESVRLRSSVIVAWLIGVSTRVSEMLDLHLNRLRYTHGQRVADVTLKGDRPHTFPIPDMVGERIDRYLDARGIGAAVALRGTTTAPPRLIVTASGGRMDRNDVNKTLVRLARAAGIQDPARVTAHVGRHTTITALRQVDVDPSKIKESFGHRNQETTDRYGDHVLGLADSPLLRSAETFAQAARDHEVDET
jgi:integrase/recombinase XerD